MSVDRAKFRAVFFGTPQFAVPCLDALCEIAEVVGVVVQPDKPAGRGNTVTAPPVKARALELGIPVIQPTKVRDGVLEAWLREQRVDLALVVAYGRILPLGVLSAPRLGCVNVHGSILPRYRGAAPIQSAILHDDSETGVTLMQMDEGMDTGAMLAMRTTAIGCDETSGALSERLSALGAVLVREELPRYVRGEHDPVRQDHALATTAPMLSKEQSAMDFTRSARSLHAQVRGLSPWPGTSTYLATRRLMVHRTTLEGAPELLAGVPGEVVRVDRDVVWVATGHGALGLCELQLEGKKRLDTRAFLVGHPMRVGTMLGPPPRTPSIPPDPEENLT
ncbi:MAG: methionyl-tRNA formyltransferase [Deltaproteobacteria bacterium]|nr:methionyl-tRNA formyltransferase [Deltaproteobacteria bacterium]